MSGESCVEYSKILQGWEGPHRREKSSAKDDRWTTNPLTRTADYCRETTNLWGGLQMQGKAYRSSVKMAHGHENTQEGWEGPHWREKSSAKDRWTTNPLTWTTDYCRETANLRGFQMQSFSKCVTNPKRDIVDTLFHASRAFGHNPILGSAFPYTWEVINEGLL